MALPPALASLAWAPRPRPSPSLAIRSRALLPVGGVLGEELRNRAGHSPVYLFVAPDGSLRSPMAQPLAYGSLLAPLPVRFCPRPFRLGGSAGLARQVPRLVSAFPLCVSQSAAESCGGLGG